MLYNTFFTLWTVWTSLWSLALQLPPLEVRGDCEVTARSGPRRLPPRRRRLPGSRRRWVLREIIDISYMPPNVPHSRRIVTTNDHPDHPFTRLLGGKGGLSGPCQLCYYEPINNTVLTLPMVTDLWPIMAQSAPSSSGRYPYRTDHTARRRSRRKSP